MIDPSVLCFPIDAPVMELPFFPNGMSGDFVYLFQTYSLLEGADIAVWTRSPDGRCTQRVYATGAIIEFHPPIDLETLPFSRDERIPRSERIEKALEALPRKEWPETFYEALSRHGAPVFDMCSEISQRGWEQLFELVSGLGDGTGAGCLGCATAVRIIFKRRDRTTDINTWDGTGDPEAVWKIIDEFLRMAGICDLPLREFDREIAQLRLAQ